MNDCKKAHVEKYNLKDVLFCLVDELKESERPSELSIDILEQYKNTYDFVEEYLEDYYKKLEEDN